MIANLKGVRWAEITKLKKVYQSYKVYHVKQYLKYKCLKR